MVGSPDDADDLLQVVWLKAVEGPLQGGADRNVRAWLFRVATHAALDRLGAEKRRAHLLAGHEGHEGTNATAPSPGLDAAARRRIRDACARLPRKQRDAVWHRWIEQEDYQSVARKLGTNVQTVRANVYHGLKRLRHELKDVWSEETES